MSYSCTVHSEANANDHPLIPYNYVTVLLSETALFVSVKICLTLQCYQQNGDVVKAAEWLRKAISLPVSSDDVSIYTVNCFLSLL